MSENAKRKYDRGIVHLTKIVFLSERKMKQNDYIGYDYEFFRWDHGPMTKDIYQDFNFFEQSGILENVRRESIPKFTEHGQDFIESCSELFTENIPITSMIDSVIAKYGKWNTHQIKEHCYGISVDYRDKVIPIKEIPKGEIIYMPKGDKSEKKDFVISTGWMETLLLLMDTDFIKDYEQSLVEIQSVGSTPMFGG